MVKGPALMRGLTLIESMIALLILAIGLLGLVALQSFALQSSQIASQRTQATSLAMRVADEFRAYRGLNNVPPEIRSDWETEVALILPGGSLAAERDGDEAVITVSWIDDRELAGPAAGDSITFRFRL